VVTRHHVRRVPRLQRHLALLLRQPCARCLHERARALLEGIEDFEEGRLSKPLGLRDLVVVVVHVPEGLSHAIARLDEIDAPAQRQSNALKINQRHSDCAP